MNTVPGRPTGMLSQYRGYRSRTRVEDFPTSRLVEGAESMSERRSGPSPQQPTQQPTQFLRPYSALPPTGRCSNELYGKTTRAGRGRNRRCLRRRARHAGLRIRPERAYSMRRPKNVSSQCLGRTHSTGSEAVPNFRGAGSQRVSSTHRVVSKRRVSPAMDLPASGG